jgi:hydrophobic/amphiphilic exporter-1 (mainly G- bacteria), HAE1 family
VLAQFFIERPVLANVIAFVTMLMGGVALGVLPVAQYPPITPPTIQVTASYPGANPRTVVDTVALPIEQQVNGVEGMLYMQSTATSDGRYTLIITFRVGTDLDLAQVLVQNRVSAALAQLPQVVQQQGVVTKKKSTAILQIVTLTAPGGQYDALFLSNFATLQLRDKLARVPGVGDVTVFGIGQYSMRIWLDPSKMQALALMPSDVINAVRAENAYVPSGQIGMPPTRAGEPFQLTIDVPGPMSRAGQFEQIIVKTGAGGAITRVRDVARVELGAQTYSQFFKMNGHVAGGIAIFQLPDANALDTATRVRAAMKELSKDFPQGLEYEVPFDTTTFVRESVSEVYHTLFEAGLLVLVVIVVFLQDWRATLVPATTVPVTIIGAFAAMAVLGFSINLLTLFAVVLAIGIVVDDAIVVVEGVAQHVERGQTPKQGSIDAMKELMGPIIGITLVLMSVFIPPAFMPGITGQMYRQFALVIAATALISAINALTLKPTQCALWLRARDPGRKKNWFFRGFNAVYEPLERRYVGVIRFMVERSRRMALIALFLIGLAIWGLTCVPTGFIPTEDQGYAMVTVQLPDGASLERTQRVMDAVAGACRGNPAVDRTIMIGGVSPLDNNASLANAGIIYLMFKDWSLRKKGEDLKSIYADLTARLKSYSDARTMVLVPPPIQGLGLSGGFQMQLELTDGSFDFERLQAAADTVVAEARKDPAIKLALTPLRASVPQVTIGVEKTQASTFGLNVGDVYSTVQAYLGSSFVNQFTLFGHQYMVYAQADAPFRRQTDSIDGYFIRTSGGAMVPLGSVARIERAQGPSLITLYNLYPSASINGAANEKFSSGQAIQAMEAIAKRTLPPGMSFEWTAMSYQEKLVGSSTYFIFGLAMLLVFFVLAGQYESWVTPAAVILGVPLALLGTVSALLGLGVANNLYVQIGLVLLIALSAKNAILIVEMALEGRAAGRSLIEATVHASAVRFRPIVMTSFTFILGVLPLLLASGAGASARKSLGLAVASGMLASTCLAVLFVPTFFVVIRGWAERRKPSTAVVPATDGAA